MPNWKQIVRKNLRVLSACSPEFTEELAGHLEDSYEASLREGVPAEVAFHRTVSQIEGRRRIWLVLRFLQEDFVTGFIRKAALPGLLTFAASAFVSYAFLLLTYFHLKIIWPANGQILALPLGVWCQLCLLSICGALGAILSRRNGGSRLHRIAAALFPSEIMGTAILLVYCVGFALSRFVPDYAWGAANEWKLLEPGLLGFVILPAAVLLLGAGVAEGVGNSPSRTSPQRTSARSEYSGQ